MDRAEPTPALRPPRQSNAERAAEAVTAAPFLDNRPGAAAQRMVVQAAARSPQASAQRALSAALHGSAYGIAQRRQLDKAFGGPVRQEPAPLQLVLEENAIEVVNERLAANNLDDYDTIIESLSSTKIAALDNLWDTIGKGKKRARKVLAANKIVEKIGAYFQTFTAKEAEWTAATYPSARASMEDHFDRHPGAWEDLEEYTDAATNTRDTLWGGRWALGQPDRQRMHDANYFVITTNAGLIVTFGDR